MAENLEHKISFFLRKKKCLERKKGRRKNVN